MAAPEATITQYGLANGAQAIAKTISNAFTNPGYIVKVSTTAGTFDGTTAVTDVPDGYVITSSVPATAQCMVNVTEGSAQANEVIGVQALIPGQEAYLQLCGATVAIAVGDFLAPSTTAGTVCPRNATGVRGACVVFARALEAKAQDATGTIKVRAISPIYLSAGVTPT